MLDINEIKNNLDMYKEVIKNRQKDVSVVDPDKLIELFDRKNVLQQEMDELRAKRNEHATKMKRQIGESERKLLIEEGKKLKDVVQEKEEEYKQANEAYLQLMDLMPNFVSDDTPVGKDESENVVVKHVGEKPVFNFAPKPHWELGEDLGIIDKDRAAEISGARFAYLMGDLVMMEFALIQFIMKTVTDQETLEKIANDAGLDITVTPFTPVLPPVFIKPDVFSKMGRLNPPDDKYYIESDDLYLIGSAEHTLGPLQMNRKFSEDELPVRYIGFSTAFRREAGSYGKDTKGILRVHQFNKLEFECFTVKEHAADEQKFLIAIQEYIMSQLELPYQVVAICTGDMGGPDYRQVDIETWMPGEDKYRETHTSDLMNDFQARRLNIRVKRTNGETEYVYMNDATAASERPLIAIMENYQNEDGSIRVPKILQEFVGKEVIGKK
jgi:seryl-tRNA synthetase